MSKILLREFREILAAAPDQNHPQTCLYLVRRAHALMVSCYYRKNTGKPVLAAESGAFQEREQRNVSDNFADFCYKPRKNTKPTFVTVEICIQQKPSSNRVAQSNLNDHMLA
jgi:hypothetical protein